MALYIVNIRYPDGEVIPWYFEDHAHWLRAVNIAKDRNIWVSDNDGDPDIITDLDEFKAWLEETYPKAPIKSDPLTLAYIAIGAARALDIRGGLKDDQSDEFEGELGFISKIIEHSDALDQAGYAEGDALNHVVWCYEIAEEFGSMMANDLLSGNEVCAKLMIRHIIKEAKDSR